MQTGIVFNASGVKVIEVEEFNLATIKVHCATRDGRVGYVEACPARFSEWPGITIWIDEEGRLDEFPVWAKLKETGEDFCGDVLICGSDEEGDSVGLTPQQVTSVKEAMEWVPGEQGTEPTMTLTDWPQAWD